MLELKVKKVHKDAILPSQTHKEDACWDLIACEDVDFGPGEIRLVDTGLQIEPPPGWRLNIYVRSSTPSKKKFILANSVGIIDSTYRGNLGIQLMNIAVAHNNLVHNKINKGDRIAQIELVRDRPECKIIEVQELSSTIRGSGGFGSTGV